MLFRSFIVKDKTQAERLAAHCAAMLPGVEWFIATITDKYVAKIGEVTSVTYSEKGVLPK